MQAEHVAEERLVAPNPWATLGVHVVASPGSHGALEGGGLSVRSFARIFQPRHRLHRGAEKTVDKFGTRKFVAWGFTPRPGSRGGSASLGHPNKPFGSARTARAPRALDLAAQGGGLSAAGRTN